MFKIEGSLKPILDKTAKEISKIIGDVRRDLIKPRTGYFDMFSPPGAAASRHSIEPSHRAFPPGLFLLFRFPGSAELLSGGLGSKVLKGIRMGCPRAPLIYRSACTAVWARWNRYRGKMPPTTIATIIVAVRMVAGIDRLIAGNSSSDSRTKAAFTTWM